MDRISRPLGPEAWIARVFSAQAVRKGAVVRRNVRWVEREIGRTRFEAEVRRRGFHMIECGGQFVVICNGGGLRVIC
jgi:hypothetical protein